MPIIKFDKLSADEEVNLKLIQEIKKWVSSVKSLGVGPEHVTPKGRDVIQENPGEHISFEVAELFTKNPEGVVRDEWTKKALCKSILNGFKDFVKKERFKVKPKTAVVYIHTVDREKGEYDHLKIES